MRKLTLLLFAGFVLSLSVNMHAQQEVNTSVGVRFGSPYALSLKKFFSEEIAVELMASARPFFGLDYSYVSLGGAVQYYIPLDLDDPDFSSLHAYVGGGANIAFWNYRNDNFRTLSGYGNSSLRIAAYVGLQYALPSAPVEFTIDWSPSINTGTTPLRSFSVGYYNLGVRYILVRR